MIYELHIDELVFRDESKDYLYDYIGQSESPWVIYEIHLSKGSPVKVTNKTYLMQFDIDKIKEERRRGHGKRVLGKKYGICALTMNEILQEPIIRRKQLL